MIEHADLSPTREGIQNRAGPRSKKRQPLDHRGNSMLHTMQLPELRDPYDRAILYHNSENSTRSSRGMEIQRSCCLIELEIVQLRLEERRVAERPFSYCGSWI